MVVIFISGAADVKKSRSVANYVSRFPTAGWRSHATFAWDEATNIESFIRSQPPGTRIRLVGHSYGGDTAAQIAARMGAAGRPLDMLITVIRWVAAPARAFSNGYTKAHAAGSTSMRQEEAASNDRTSSPAWVAHGTTRQWRHADEFINVPNRHIDFRHMMDASIANGRSVFLEAIAP